MRSETIQSRPWDAAEPRRILDRLARRSVHRLLSTLQGGALTVFENGVPCRFGDPAGHGGVEAQVHVLDPRTYRAILLYGSIGAGEAFMAGHWRSPDLTAVIRLLSRNMARVTEMDSGGSRLMTWFQRLRHRVSANTIRGARRNIHAHYDLSNELFATFLDRRMMYSAAMFPDPDTDLETAAAHKLQRIGEKLALAPDDHVVEIGTGWGGLAVYLAEQFGCRVTTTTISREQYEHACRLVRDRGLEGRVTVLEQDYRTLEGTFDKLVSVEMIEAVGQAYLPVYLRKCDALLKPGGRMLIQAITIPGQRYELASRSVDFIQRYIFPGGSLPSIEAILGATRDGTRLQMDQLEEIGIDYAHTLRHWQQRFMSNLPEVRALGFDERFIRMWQFYLSYCEGGFLERAIGTAQIRMIKV